MESADNASNGMDGGDGVFHRVRSNPRLAIAAAVGALLVVAWIAWAVYVTSDQGARAGLGVVIAWPAMLAALALISLPFIGGYLLIRRSSESEGGTAVAESPESDEDDDGSEDDGSEDDGSDDEEEESKEEEGDDDSEEESGSEEEASGAS